MKIFKNAKIYNSVTDYQNNAKNGDFIALGGTGIMCGIKNARAKKDFFKFTAIKDEKIHFKPYRGTKELITIFEQQQVLVIEESEYKKLPIY